MRTRSARSPREHGFTLMEMLVVLVVIGLIAAVPIPQVMGLMGSAKSKAAKIQLETVSQSLTFYQLDLGRYPDTSEGLAALWKPPAQVESWAGPYVRGERQLVDPWGRPFVYRSPGETAAFELLTLGADGKEGGTGEDADLSAAN